jgi:hypothetical protein
MFLATSACPAPLAVTNGASVWTRSAFAGAAVIVMADSCEPMTAQAAHRQRTTASGFVVLEMPAFAAKASATSVSFSCDAKSDDDAFAPLRLRKLTHAQLTRDGGRPLAARFESADALLLAGRIDEASARFDKIAEDAGARPTGVLSALTALEARRRLDQPELVAKHPLAFWLAHAAHPDDSFADEISYRGARAALAWRDYESAFALLARHDHAHLTEMRRQALLITVLREAMTDAYLAQDDERVATLYAKYGAQLIGDENAWSLVTMASESLLELDLPNEALATFAQFDSRRSVVCNSLLHLDAAVAAQRPDEARELIASLRPQTCGQQKRRLEQLARAISGDAR